MGASHSSAYECRSPSSFKLLVERGRRSRPGAVSNSISNNSTGLKTQLDKARKHRLWRRNHDSSTMSDRQGDVFIYPPNYRDLNECQKCERDNKICNCIEIEVSSLRSQSVTLGNHGDSSASSNATSISAAPVAADANISEHKSIAAPGESGSYTEESRHIGCRKESLFEVLVTTATTTTTTDHNSYCKELNGKVEGDEQLRSKKANSNCNLCEQITIGQNCACEKNENSNSHYATMSACESSEVNGPPTNQQVSQACKTPEFERDQSTRKSSITSIATMPQASPVRREMRSKRYHGLKLSRQAILPSEDLNDSSLEKFRSANLAIISMQDPITTTADTMDLFVHGPNKKKSADGVAILSASPPFVCAGKGGGGGGHNVETQAEDNKQIDYSPILTSVRDYIENVNSEIQLSATKQSPSVLVGSIVPNMLGLQPATVTSPGVEGILHPPLATPAILTTMTLTASTPTASASSHLKSDPPETSKKSIFDGASKDEILEYLEDARERVPEVLIAADEVMVIGENELILVNQLEPNLPATPISIVDSREVIASTAEVAPAEQPVSLSTTSAVVVPLPVGALVDRDSIGSMDSPSSFDDHLFDHVANKCFANESQQSSENFRSLDSTLLSSIDDRSIALMSPGSSNMIMREFNHFAGQSTIESIDSQIVNLMTDNDSPQGDNSDLNLKHLLGPSTSSMSESSNKSVSDHQLCISDRVTSMLRHSTRRKSTSESSSRADARRVNRMMLMHSAAHSRTQDSISTSSTSPSNSSTTSSTPASTSSSSSTSNSRSSSSNQTSGNCSAASNFLYNLPSLSRSSPYLALGANCILTTTIASVGSPTGITPPPLQPAPHAQNMTQPLYQDHLSKVQAVSLYEPAHGLLLVEPQTAVLNGSREERECVDPALVSPIPGQHTMFTNISNEFPIQHLAQQQLVERGDSGLGTEASLTVATKFLVVAEEFTPDIIIKRATSSPAKSDEAQTTKIDTRSGADSDLASLSSTRLSVIDENTQDKKEKTAYAKVSASVVREQRKAFANGTRDATAAANAKKTIGLGRHSHSHYATINRLNDYLIKRQQQTIINHSDDSYLDILEQNSTMIEFQCLDCDQFIVTEQARVLRKANELRLLRESEIEQSLDTQHGNARQQITMEQIDRAYVAALNGLPLCKACEKKRGERKEIISEFVETELKYGRDLKIIHDEFYRPMQIAGLLNKDQINGIFLNLDELIMAHCRFAERLELTINEAQSIGDTDFNTVNIGKLFVESAEMLHTFESYCIQQGTAACLLARLAKEKELLRIFLRVSQMENTLLRRMNLAAFLMVPVQRVTKYPLLLNRLYKVTAYHHKDREALRDAQLKVELHLEHINQQTKGISATNKIWRRISALSTTGGSASASNRAGGGRALISAEDIGNIKLRKTAMELLNWDRDQTQFIHSGRISFATLNEYLVKQKMKSLKYMSAHALLIVLGKPNWKYRPDLVKSSLDNKHFVPTAGGNGIKEAALLLFREKNGRFIACREPLLLSNCVLSNDCSQFNHELPHHHHSHSHGHFGGGGSGGGHKQQATATSSSINLLNPPVSTGATTQQPTVMYRRSSPGVSGAIKARDLVTLNEFRAASAESQPLNITKDSSHELAGFTSMSKPSHSLSLFAKELADKSDQIQGDSISMFSLKCLPEDQSAAPISPPVQTSRSYSLASALPRTPITTISSTNSIHSLTANGKGHQPLPNEHQQQQNNHLYSHHFFHNHHQPYGDYQESFEIHECSSKDSFLLRADTTLKTRYWLQMLRYHAKDLGYWRLRRQGLANIMMMRQE